MTAVRSILLNINSISISISTQLNINSISISISTQLNINSISISISYTYKNAPNTSRMMLNQISTYTFLFGMQNYRAANRKR